MTNRRQSRANRILSRLNGRSIVLLGMMGCGKSAIGKMVARKLGLEFKDADTEIEAAAGRTVADIFAEYGEEEFRRLEERVIERILSEGPVLLALGGGAFMAQPTRAVISRHGLSVWIKADLDLLMERVGRRPNKRPLLKQGDPREILSKLLQVREPVYAKAELHIQSQSGTKSEMRNVVLEALDEHLKDPS
jgi:shikimate kinase